VIEESERGLKDLRIPINFVDLSSYSRIANLEGLPFVKNVVIEV
jgi:hypothetical protein